MDPSSERGPFGLPHAVICNGIPVGVVFGGQDPPPYTIKACDERSDLVQVTTRGALLVKPHSKDCYGGAGVAFLWDKNIFKKYSRRSILLS